MTHDADSLFAAIQHGDDRHRAWLRSALVAYFADQPIPPPDTPVSADARLARERALEDAAKIADVTELSSRVELHAPWTEQDKLRSHGAGTAARLIARHIRTLSTSPSPRDAGGDEA